MSLKAVLFDCSGAIVNDTALRRQLYEALLLSEGSRLEPGEFQAVCLGRSDRTAIAELLRRRSCPPDEGKIARLTADYTTAYCERLDAPVALPLCPGIIELVRQLWSAGLVLGVVTGLPQSVASQILQRTGLEIPFSVAISGDDTTASKPDPQGYHLALDRLGKNCPGLDAANCLAIESTYAGLAAARAAGLLAAAVANLYPLHMLQRRADWAVDDLRQLEIERVGQTLAR